MVCDERRDEASGDIACGDIACGDTCGGGTSEVLGTSVEVVCKRGGGVGATAVAGAGAEAGAGAGAGAGTVGCSGMKLEVLGSLVPVPVPAMTPAPAPELAPALALALVVALDEALVKGSAPVDDMLAPSPVEPLVKFDDSQPCF
jgi:hypothetical protein